MANADFSQKQNSTSGGFDAGSYREQKQPEQAVPLTPLQQKGWKQSCPQPFPPAQLHWR